MTSPYIGNPPAPQIDYAALPGLLEKATPGPWQIMMSDNATPHIMRNGAVTYEDLDSVICWMPAEITQTFNSLNNSKLIALAPTLAADNIRLLAANADLMAEVGRLTGLVEEARDMTKRLIGLSQEWCDAVNHDSSWDGWDHHYKAMRYKLLPDARTWLSLIGAPLAAATEAQK